MRGSAAPYAAVAGLNGRLSRHDRDLVGGGFELVYAEFRVAADEFDQLVALELRRRRTEQDRARDAAETAGPPRRPAATAVPPWLADSDREWCTGCHQLLEDLAAAGPALRDTAASYQQTASRVAASLGALAEEDAASGLVARPLPSIESTGVVPAGAARGDPPAHHVDARVGVPSVPAAPTISAAPATLTEALALWRARSGDSAQLTDALTADALAVPSWRVAPPRPTSSG